MKIKIFITFSATILAFLSANSALAALCKKDQTVFINMSNDWYEEEAKRLSKEEQLLKKYSDYISKEEKPLIAQPFICKKGEICDPIKNCQMEKEPQNFKEIQYSIKLDSNIVISKSYCSMIGKCIGYNDFTHNSKITADEDRLIEVRKDNAIFQHYFYSAKSKAYEPPINMTNFHTGYELKLDDNPHFSPDEKFMIEVRSRPFKHQENGAPSGYNINIYQMNEFGEYINIEPAEYDPQNPSKVISTFLSRNPACGETPYFHSWKNNYEARLSMLPPSQANQGRRVILSYDKKAKKWGCYEDLYPEFQCKSYLPKFTDFTSNIDKSQIEECH